VGNEAKLKLAIRTILATTRVAVKSNQAAGRDDLALESARRGEALLDDLSSRLPPDASAGVWQTFDDARGRLTAISVEAGRRPLSIGADDGSLDEHVDVRAELGSKLS
jgi:hypothetical protein